MELRNLQEKLEKVLFLMPCPSQLPRASNKERLLSLAPLHTKVGMHRRKKGRKIWHDKSNDTRHTFSITAYRVSGFGEKI